MADPRTIIEHAAERVQPKADAFERLERRRRRRLRNRRITSGVVAMLVAVGGSYTAFALFRNASPLVGSGPSGGSGASGGPPIAAQVMCDGAITVVETPVVQPQPDGVHLQIDNTSGQDLRLEVKEVGGQNAPSGTSQTEWQFGPGIYEVRCTAPATAGGYQALEVQDPTHLWISPDLSCNSVTGVASAMAPGAVGEKSLPVEILREHVTGLQPNDVMEPGGYPQSPEPEILVVRDGQVIASYHFMSDGQEGWLLDSSQQCFDVPLGWSEASSSTYPRGAFTWCPSPPFLDLPSDWKVPASDVAIKFVDLYRSGDAAALRDLMDLGVPEDASWPITIAPGTSPTILGTSAAGGDLVQFGCGPDVDAHTVSVTFDDGTSSTSLDFTLYVAYRSDGWKVWGAY
jgi:hypothetical protein